MKSSITTIVGVAMAISLIIASLSVGYYFVIYLPNLENQKLLIEQQKQEYEEKAESERMENLKKCESEAKEASKTTLANRVELMEETGKDYGSQYEVMKQAVEQGLFNKDDYNQFYDNCLQKYGL